MSQWEREKEAAPALLILSPSFHPTGKKETNNKDRYRFITLDRKSREKAEKTPKRPPTAPAQHNPLPSISTSIGSWWLEEAKKQQQHKTIEKDRGYLISFSSSLFPSVRFLFLINFQADGKAATTTWRENNDKRKQKLFNEGKSALS